MNKALGFFGSVLLFLSMSASAGQKWTIHEWGTFTSLQDESGNAIGGIKVITKDGWFAARPSGTEDVYKIYAESFQDRDHLQRIQKEAQATIAQVLNKQPS